MQLEPDDSWLYESMKVRSDKDEDDEDTTNRPFFGFEEPI